MAVAALGSECATSGQSARDDRLVAPESWLIVTDNGCCSRAQLARDSAVEHAQTEHVAGTACVLIELASTDGRHWRRACLASCTCSGPCENVLECVNVRRGVAR